MVTPSTKHQPSAGTATTSLYTRMDAAAKPAFAPYMRNIGGDGRQSHTHQECGGGSQCDVLRGGGVRWRPQGGRGHDHPTQVQQRKAQTVCHFSPSHSTLSSSSSQIPVKSLTSDRILSTPGVLVTLRSNLSGSIIWGGGAIVTLKVSLDNYNF